MHPKQELLYFDRYENLLKPERIYGEKPLRWTYETSLGRIFLESVVKRRWFSSLYGLWADSRISAREIAPFLDRFDVDPSEFLDPPESFRTFNEFFHRRLKPEARPVAPGFNSAVFPADGRHLFLPDLSESTRVYAKGQRFDLASLLGDRVLADRFARGSAVLSRLCPTDYHRFHFPLAGESGAPRLVNGSLYSVNPLALSRRLDYLFENKRQVTEVKHPAIGAYLYLEIGATNVGSIVSTAKAGIVEKGDEKGYFRFGGSMVVTVFPQGAIRPAEDLETHSAKGVELYARMGDAMAVLK